ncbi:hypothetical protein GGR54DRAFT_453179 [Hypoxylon sp. NC1633]|nr:hypothetical protein GGR54DRAFT_453179 [Hypoxylon sp. NC1633]
MLCVEGWWHLDQRAVSRILLESGRIYICQSHRLCRYSAWARRGKGQGSATEVEHTSPAPVGRSIRHLRVVFRRSPDSSSMRRRIRRNHTCSTSLKDPPTPCCDRLGCAREFLRTIYYVICRIQSGPQLSWLYELDLIMMPGIWPFGLTLPRCETEHKGHFPGCIPAALEDSFSRLLTQRRRRFCAFWSRRASSHGSDGNSRH